MNHHDRLRVAAIVTLGYNAFHLAVEAKVFPQQRDEFLDREFRSHAEARAWADEICTSRGWLLVDRTGEEVE
jgi:hypothetical protein